MNWNTPLPKDKDAARLAKEVIVWELMEEEEAAGAVARFIPAVHFPLLVCLVRSVARGDAKAVHDAALDIVSTAAMMEVEEVLKELNGKMQ